MKIFINDVDYTNHLAPGIVISSTLTEELDSATIILNFMPYTNFEPFQKVRIELEEGVNRYFLINTYVDTQITFANPILYTYTLKLISETKKLERVILPNLSIKKPIGRNTKRIIDYLNWIIMPYVKEQFAELYIDSNDEINFPFLTNNCPEIQWATPNAKSAINDLLSSIPNNPYLVRVENNRLTWVSLSHKNNEISKKGIVKIENYQQMSETANNLVFDAQNVVPTQPSLSTFLNPRTDSEADLTTNNMAFIIPNAKIERVQSLKVKILLNYQWVVFNSDGTTTTNTGYQFLDLDITDKLVEKSIYDTYKSSSNALLGIDEKGYKRNVIYYKQGGNSIEGVYYTDEYTGSETIGDYSLKRIIQSAIAKYCEENNIASLGYEPNWREYYYIPFEIEFYSIGDFRLKTYKTNTKSEDTSLKSQQNQQYIDMLTLEQFQRQSIKRLGNEVLSISAIYHKIEEVPKLSDWYGDNYILAQSEIAYRPDYILFSGLFSKNYLVSNQYYGIQSRRRYTQFVTTGEAVVREENKIFNITFSLTQNTIEVGLSNYFASYFNSVERGNNHLDAFLFITQNAENIALERTLLQPYVYSGQKATYVTAQCIDNVAVGKKVTKVGNHRTQEYVLYTDDYGEFKSYGIGLLKNFKIYNLDRAIEEYYSREFGNYMEALFEYPNIPDSATYEVITSVTGTIYKDNGEIFKQTIQFNFSSDDERIIIGNIIGRENSLTDNIKHSLTFVYSTTAKLDKDNPNATSYSLSINVFLFCTSNRVFLSYSGFPSAATRFWNSLQSWALIDEEKNVVVGMNKLDEDIQIKQEFYINAL